MTAIFPYEPSRQFQSYPTNRNGKKINAFIRANQARGFAFVPTVSSIPSQGNSCPASFFSTAGSLWKFQLQGGNPNRLGSILSQWNITVSTAITIPPFPYMFQLVNIRNNDQTYIVQDTADTLFDRILSEYNDGELKALAKLIGMSSKSTTDASFGAPVTLQAGTYNLYLPHVKQFWDNGDIVWGKSQESLWFEFYSSGFDVNNYITVNGVQMLIEDHNLSEEDPSNTDAYSKVPIISNYLYPIQQTNYTSYSLKSGNNYLQCTQFQGKLSHIQCIIRPSGTSQTSLSYYSACQNIGEAENAGLDWTTNSKESISGNGSPIQSQYLTNFSEINNNTDNSFNVYRKSYTLSFTNKVSKAYDGVLDGYFNCDANNYNVNICCSSGTNQVQTVTLNNTNTSGSYRFYLGGDFTNYLAYSASASTMQTAINNLPYCLKNGVTVTVSQALSAGTSFTITINNPSDVGFGAQGMIQVVGVLLESSTYDSPVTTITTVGQAGLNFSNSYDIYLYGYKFSKVLYSPSGAVLVSDV